MVYRGEAKASPQQMRAAIEALPYEQPKRSAVAVGYLTANDFASRLDRAIDRSEPCEADRGQGGADGTRSIESFIGTQIKAMCRGTVLGSPD